MRFRFEYWVLDENHNARVAKDVIEWGRFMESRKSIVEQTAFECGVWVSTIFLGIDHRNFGEGPPVLFETMIFEMTAEGDSDQCRYSSWDDAATGHKAAVRRVKEQLVQAKLSVKEVEIVR